MPKLNELPELTTLADDDLLLVWDKSANVTAKMQLSTLKSFLGTTNTTSSTVKELAYSLDGDNNGLCYFLGTSKSVAAWRNPQNIDLAVTASAIGAGSVESLIDRQASEFYTPSSADSWVKLTLFNGDLKCKYYSIRNRSSSDHYLRSWKLQGSNNDSNWVDIDVQINNTTLNNPSQWLSLPVTTTSTYKQFRLLMTGQNSAGYSYLCIGEIELYGTYTY